MAFTPIESESEAVNTALTEMDGRIQKNADDIKALQDAAAAAKADDTAKQQGSDTGAQSDAGAGNTAGGDTGGAAQQ